MSFVQCVKFRFLFLEPRVAFFFLQWQLRLLARIAYTQYKAKTQKQKNSILDCLPVTLKWETSPLTTFNRYVYLLLTTPPLGKIDRGRLST